MYNEIKNLYEETNQVLIANNKVVDDIVWIGTNDGSYSIDSECWYEFSKNINYIPQSWDEIPLELVVVGKDWWLERHMNDEMGTSWWEYKSLPAKAIDSKPFKLIPKEYMVYEIKEND